MSLLDLEDLDVPSNSSTAKEQDDSYKAEDVWQELVLWGSLLLRVPSLFVLRGRGFDTETINSKMAPLVDYFCSASRASTRDRLGVRHHPDVDLPDVCGVCFYSFGLTPEGRYRLGGCPKCKGLVTDEDQPKSLSFERAMAMAYLPCLGLGDAVLCQLIYKYYSPNGDATWELKKLNPFNRD
jgi:hypothetical protein